MSAHSSHVGLTLFIYSSLTLGVLLFFPPSVPEGSAEPVFPTRDPGDGLQLPACSQHGLILQHPAA